MTIYILDRNLIIDIEHYNHKRFSSEKSKPETIHTLQQLDQSDNIFSCLFSALEGYYKRPQSIEEFIKTTQEEINTLKEFFNVAKVDEENLQKATLYLEENSKILPIESNFSLFSKFLKEINFLILPTIKSTKILSQCDEIIKIANKYQIPASHYIVVACLAIVAGSSECRKLLKPKINIKKLEYYNVLSDISVIFYLNILNSISKEADVKFLTHDHSLQFFLDNLIIERSVVTKQDSENTCLNTTVKYTNNLFPNLSEKDFLLLMNKLIEN